MGCSVRWCKATSSGRLWRGIQAQKQGKPRPAAAFQLHESEGMQDLLSLMQKMSVGGGGTAELPQANGDLSSHDHPAEGASRFIISCCNDACHFYQSHLLSGPRPVLSVKNAH